MLRIIAGTAKGRRLETPRGEAARPTTDRVKESLFGLLGDRLDGALVMDLCAGSGALGIEALSRGAKFCTFVEGDRACQEIIQRNLDSAGLGSYGRVIPMTLPGAVTTLAKETGERPSLILADPPYDKQKLAQDLVNAVATTGLLAPDGILTIERPLEHGLANQFGSLELWREKVYGKTCVLLYRQTAEGPGEG